MSKSNCENCQAENATTWRSSEGSNHNLCYGCLLTATSGVWAEVPKTETLTCSSCGADGATDWHGDGEYILCYSCYEPQIPF